ncbi:DNA repair protein RadC [Blautia schinkii]|nr:DNA repair protein RadC [Blautia schinkii]
MRETIKELPESQRPYEKCIREGESVLSDSELLAVILRSGTRGSNSLSLANNILNIMEETSYPGLLGLLHISLPDLMKVHGIGKVKAVQLKCIGELSKRIASTAARPQLSFQHPSSIAKYYMEQLRHEEQELLFCMMLDSGNHLLGEQLLTRGTANATLVTPREVYMEALRHHAVSLILVHNHPSGDPAPSEDDMDVTERVFRAGELLGIHLLDHIIIGDHKYVSFREQGILKQYTG